MAPRLYLILSDERSGLVKIGRTDPNESNLDDTAVIKRVQELRTGISDSSTVVQAPGAAIFETWLHQFMGEKRKPVTIRFAFRPDFAIRPKEWFDLSPNLAQILAEAFMSKSPQTVDEVNVSDLPIFLAGAMAIIRWHAERESPETLAAMAATAEIQSLVDRMRTTEHLPTQRPELGPTAAISSDKSAPSLTDDATPIRTAQPDVSTARDLVNAPIQLARLRVQLQALRETETLRTYIAFTVAVLVAFIGAFGSPIGATWFAIVGTLLLAFWPNVLPRAAARVVGYMRRDAAAVRSKNSARMEDE